MKISKNRKSLQKKRYIIPGVIILLLIIGRLLLPMFLKNHVNNVLANIPGYYGQISDIDVSLIRGAYVIDSLYLNKIDAGSEVPFLNFEKTDISVEWKSLFKGEIVSEIIMSKPKVIYVFEDHEKSDSENPEIDDWSKALTDLVPIEINRLQINNGKLAFVQLSADPNIDLHFYQVNMEAKNLRNVVNNHETLPSSFNMQAVSIGGGQVSLNGKANLVKKIPDVDLSFSLENSDATSLNDFTNYYAGIDFKSGQYSVYSEIAIADGYLKGYVKPILKDSKLIGKEDGFLEVLWEGFVGFFKFALKNQKNNTLATQIPLEGNLNNIEGNAWVTTIGIFQNAWIDAFKGVTDDSVDFEDAKKADEK